MSSTTTSATSSDSSTERLMEVETTQAQDEEQMSKSREWIDTKARKRERAEREADTSAESSTDGKESAPPSPKKKRRKMRRLEVPQPTGQILHFTGVTEDFVKTITKEFETALIQKKFPGSECEIINTKYIKRLPTEEEKLEFQAETKRLSKEKQKNEGKPKKELTEAEKEARRIKNADPVYQEKKKEMQKLKREVFNSNIENKKQYKELVKKKFGETPRKKRVVTKKIEGSYVSNIEEEKK